MGEVWFGQASAEAAQGAEPVPEPWSVWETHVREGLAALAWPGKGRSARGPLGQHGELSLMLVPAPPAEPIDEGLKHLGDPGLAGRWTLGSPCAVLVDWTHAAGFRGCLVRMDAQQRVVWNVPAMTPVHNFSDFRTLHPTLGITLKKAKSTGRPSVPSEALLLQKMWSVPHEGGDATVDACLWCTGAPAKLCALCTLPFCDSEPCIAASPPPQPSLDHHKRLQQLKAGFVQSGVEFTLPRDHLCHMCTWLVLGLASA